MIAAGAVAFILIAADVHFHGLIARTDPVIAQYLSQHIGGTEALISSAISGMGELLVIGPLSVLVGIALIYRRRWRAVIGWAAALLGSAVINKTLKDFFAVPRPSRFTAYTFGPHPGYSFPSGHTMSVAIFAGALVLVMMHLKPTPRWKRMMLAVVVAGLSLLEAAGLLLIRVHYVSDLLGALAVSLCWLGVVRLIIPPRIAPVPEQIRSVP